MAQADGTDIIAPRMLILPDVSNKNIGANYNVSGMMCISGSQVMYWTKGKWYYISGMVAVQPLA